jgi:hypothetical protein
MFTVDIQSNIGQVGVQTTQNRGFTPEEMAADCASRIISISSTADPVLRQQAEAFKEAVLQQISYYMKEAIKSDRTTLIAELENQGQQEMANILRRL